MIRYLVVDAKTGQLLITAFALNEADARLNEREGVRVLFEDGPAQFNSYRNADGEWIEIPPAPIPECQWDWAMHTWIDGRTLEQLRAAKWEEIKAARDAAEISGFPYMGKVIDSDPRSVQRLTGAVQAAQEAIKLGQPFAIEWTCADNTMLALDAESMTGMPAALAMFANLLHEQARALRAEIADAQTPAEVAAIVWPAAMVQLQSGAT